MASASVTTRAVASLAILALACFSSATNAARSNPGLTIVQPEHASARLGQGPTVRSIVSYSIDAQADHVPELPGVGAVEGFNLFSG